jgi:hypothetical protein
MSQNGPSADPEQELSEVLVACLEAEMSSPLDRQVLLARYPDFALELERFFTQWDGFDRLAAPLREAVRAAATPACGLDLTLDEAADDLPAQLPRSLAGYELLEELGSGGMGVVYKARQKSPGRLVALKMIRANLLTSAEDVRRFHNEAETVASLDHPHIVPVHEVGEESGRLYFSMKLMAGAAWPGNWLDFMTIRAPPPLSWSLSRGPFTMPISAACFIATSSHRTSSWTRKASRTSRISASRSVRKLMESAQTTALPAILA